MANDFLLVTPGGWIELENAPAQFASVSVDPATVQDLTMGRDWNNLSTPLQELGLLDSASNELIIDARFINTEAGVNEYRFWYIRNT